jgi:putative phosphoesterase
MSDSHGRVEPVRRALAVLDAEGADAYVHCGDIGSLEVLEEFAGRRCWFVWGNTDHPPTAWRAELDTLGLPWPDGRCAFDLAGKRIAVFHGHEPDFGKAIASEDYDFVFYGHSHQSAEGREGRTRVINPGALHRANIHSVALLDLETGKLEFININTYQLA